MNLLMEVSAALALTNVALLIVLLIVYLRIYRSSKAIFTQGLIFFAGMLILHNAIAIYAYGAMEPLYDDKLLPYFVAIHGAELIGIAVLLKITV
jgi:hypothetical protein